MPTRDEIVDAGERIVAGWLSAKGYSIKAHARISGSTDIEAIGRDRKLLVLVKSSLAPDWPSSLAREEEEDVMLRAARLAYQAWEARVQVDARLDLVGDIQWRRLSTGAASKDHSTS